MSMTPEERARQIVSQYAHWLPMGADETLKGFIAQAITDAEVAVLELMERPILNTSPMEVADRVRAGRAVPDQNEVEP